MRELATIKALCERYKTEPKILLIPSRSMKTQILKALADNGINPLNLSVKTVKELAYSIAENHIRKSGLEIIDMRETTNIITDILKDLQAQNALCFFDKMEITFGICSAIAKTILELFDNGFLNGDVDLSKIENANKRKDLASIISAYTTKKKNHNYVDHTDVANMAALALEQQPSGYVAGYALQACTFTVLEERIINRLNCCREAFEACRYTETDFALQAKQVDFFETYGEYNEIKEVIRRIIQNKIPFDHVLIVATASEPYSQLIYQLMQQYTYENEALSSMKNFPVTFGTGLPLLLSAPAKLLMLLLDWIDSGYRRHEFINIFSSDMFDIKVDQRDAEGNLPELDEQFSRLGVVNLINRANLTWQRRSYIPCFKNQLAEIRERVPVNTKAEKAAVWLIGFIEKVFGMIPETSEDGTVDVELLNDALIEIVNQYKRIYSAFDSQGLRVASQELKTSLKGRRVNLNEAVAIIREHMKNIRIQSDSPSPGRMHFTTYQQAAWIEREYVFVVGLGADNFPGMAMEDPLLLDTERISPPMLTSINRINKNIEVMTAFLADIKEHLICSYSSYDTVEIRECYPTTLFNRLEEMYPASKRKTVEFVLDSENAFIDGNDYWIHHGIKKGIVGEPKETEAPEETAAFVPMWNPAEDTITLELSATALSVYLQCKYKYFLKHILKLKAIKQDDFDALGWLSALETGIIYHKIFETFILQAIENPDMLKDKETATTLIQSITEKEIAAMEEELPTASAFHTARQRAEILQNVTRFVEFEVTESVIRKPEYAELSFGKEEPVVIDLGEGRKIKVTGVIDRIDSMKDGSVEIIDYKTGSTWIYKGLRSPKEVGIDEANVQLALYYLALKEAARNNEDEAFRNIDDVTKMSYRFVSAKGNYEIISLAIEADAEETYKAALLALYKAIEKGEFPPIKGKINVSDEKEYKVDCRYCDYNSVCEYAFAAIEQEAM